MCCWNLQRKKTSLRMQNLPSLTWTVLFSQSSTAGKKAAPGRSGCLSSCSPFCFKRVCFFFLFWEQAAAVTGPGSFLENWILAGGLLQDAWLALPHFPHFSEKPGNQNVERRGQWKLLRPCACLSSPGREVSKTLVILKCLWLHLPGRLRTSSWNFCRRAFTGKVICNYMYNRSILGAKDVPPFL